MTSRPAFLALLITLGLANITSADDCSLLGSYPIDEARNVHVSASIHLRFSDAMDAATLKHLRLFQRMGDRDVEEERVVVGLPHGREKQGGFETLPHQPNGLVFRSGLLYQSIGSTSSSGGPSNWGVAEQPLSACVIEIDVSRIKPPLDVHPSTKFGADGSLVLLRPSKSAG